MSLKKKPLFATTDPSVLRSLLNFARTAPRARKPSLDPLIVAGVAVAVADPDDSLGAQQNLTLDLMAIEPRLRLLAYAWSHGSFTAGEAAPALGLACCTIRDFGREWADAGLLSCRRGHRMGHGRGENVFSPNFEALNAYNGKPTF